MENMKNVMKAHVFVSVGSKGIRMCGAGLKGTNMAYKELISLYRDPFGDSVKTMIEKELVRMSKKAQIASPFPGVYVIPEDCIPELKALFENAEIEFQAQTDYIVANYDTIKDTNLKLVNESIKGLTKKKQAEILKLTDNYPTAGYIASHRKLFLNILASPFGAPSNVAVFNERLEDSAQELYKKAVFDALIPAYTALATYYSKLCNRQDIGTKSRNFFTDKVIPELFEGNTVRRDGFTDKVIDAIKHNMPDIFEDAEICYNIVLNIYHEAKACGMEDVMPDLQSMEAQKLKGVSKPRYVLTEESIEEDVPNRARLEEMCGLVAIGGGY
jgi:hypothetical protein